MGSLSDAGGVLDRITGFLDRIDRNYRNFFLRKLGLGGIGFLRDGGWWKSDWSDWSDWSDVRDGEGAGYVGYWKGDRRALNEIIPQRRSQMSSLLLQSGARILFQGDSITDAGRFGDPAGLGSGYVNVLAGWLAGRYPELNLTVLNRGTSGHRIYDLEERWSADAIELQPDWLSILIGINDTWRRYDSNLISAPADFEACYRRILDRIIKETSANIIMLEPFLLPTPADRIAWREDLDPRIAAVRRVACDYAALYLPFDGLFAAAATRQPAPYWLHDGVHPTAAGHAFIAQTWLDGVGGR